MSQAQLAGEGISKPYMSRLESGTRPPTERVVTYLAERLNVAKSELLHSEVLTLPEALAAVVSAADAEQAFERLRATLRGEPDADPALRWQALWLLAEQQDGNELALLQELTSLADEIDQPALRAQARARLARHLRAQGELEQAHAAAQQALEAVVGSLIDPADTALILLALVSIETETGRTREAEKHADQLESLLPDLPRRIGIEALWTVAAQRIYQGRYPDGRVALEQAMHGLRSNEDLVLWMRLRLAAARLHLMIEPQDLQAAAQRLGEAEPAVRLIGRARHHQEFQTMRARLAFLRGDYAECQRLCEGIDPRAKHLDYRDRLRHQALIAQLRIATGDSTAAADLERLAQQARERGNFELASEIWRALAKSLEATVAPSAGQRPDSAAELP